MTKLVPKQEPYIPHTPITTPEDAQRRLDEIWTRVVNVLSVGKVLFLLRSDVTEDHVLLRNLNYRVDVPKPTRASLQDALYPKLGQQIAEDAGVGVMPRPLEILPMETPRILEWTAKSCAVWCRLCFFRLNPTPKIVIAREIPK